MRRLNDYSRSSLVRSLILLAGAVFMALSASTVLQAGQAAGDQPSVWDGVYTAEQAERGRVAFISNCVECHGADLQGGEGSPLTGQEWWDSWRESTVGRLFDFVSTNMPFDCLGELAGTLPRSTYLDLVAYILSRNDFPAGDVELTAESAPAIQIIAEDGPGELPNSTLAYAVGCLEEGPDGWQLTSGSRAIRAGDLSDADRDQALGTHVYPLMFVLTPLDDYVGWKMGATGLLIGDGGVDGINVSNVEPIAEACQ